MKRTLLFLLTLVSLAAFAQPRPEVGRAGPANTVVDQRLRAKLNFIPPYYLDTAQANLSANIGNDSCGAIIVTHDNKLWKRACVTGGAKQWVEVNSGLNPGTDSIRIRRDSIFVFTRDTVYYVGNLTLNPSDTANKWVRLIQNNATNDSIIYYIGSTRYAIKDNGGAGGGTNKVDSVTFNRYAGVDTVKYWVNGTSYIAGYVPRKDGLISGGVVTWISGLTFEVSAAVYSINGTVYFSPTSQITLNAADPTNPRIDVLALNTSSTLVKLTGTAAANPAEPQADPASQLALTSIYIAAAATTPQGVTQTVVYDENIEWTTSATSGITANFNSTAITAKNGTKSIAVSSFSSGGTLRFTNGTTVSRANYTAIKFWLNLTVALTSQDIYVQFFNGNRSASDQQRALFTKSSTGGWQSASLNLSQFTFTNQNFDRVQLTFSGSSSSTLYADYIVLQGGITQGGGSGEVDPLSLHLSDTTNKWVQNATLSAGGDSLIVYKNGVRTATKITGAGGSSGGTLNNVGTGYDVAVQGTSNVKRLAAPGIIHLDSTTTANTLTITADTLSVNLDTFIHQNDTLNKWVSNATLNATGDSLIVYKNGTRTATKIKGGVWGSITGTLSDQADLRSALDSSYRSVTQVNDTTFTFNRNSGLKDTIRFTGATIDTANHWVNRLYRKTGTDSVFYQIGTTQYFAFRDSTGGSGAVSQPANQIVYGTGTGVTSNAAFTYVSNVLTLNQVDIDQATNAFSLNYIQFKAKTASTGIASVFVPNGTPTGNAYAFQFNSSSTASASFLLFAGANNVSKHVIAVDNSGSTTKYPMVFRVSNTAAWSSTADAMSIFPTTANVSIGTTSDIGRFGLVSGGNTSSSWAGRIRNSGGNSIISWRDDQSVGIRTEAQNSNLDVDGSFGAGITTLSASTTLTTSQHTVLCDATTAVVALTLPTASTSTRRIYVIKKIDASANAVTFTTAEGAQSLTTRYTGKVIQSDGTNWYIIGSF